MANFFFFIMFLVIFIPHLLYILIDFLNYLLCAIKKVKRLFDDISRESYNNII